MFPNKIENVDYDFLKPENYERWRGTFANSLDKVLEQVHPSLKTTEDALLYVEELILTLMGKICAKPLPYTIQDVEERVGKTFPNPIDQWAINDAREFHKTKKKKPVLPVDRIHTLLQKDVFLCKIETLVTLFIVAILEYIAADILKLAGNYVKKISCNVGSSPISSQDIKTSMNADKALMEMFYQEQVTRKDKGGERALAPPIEPSRTPRTSLTYDELVRDLMNDEKQYLRDLHLIIRVFKEEIEKILPKDSKDIELIFGNIVEIYELTLTLLGSLEDTVESASETQMPHIAICFEELAEAEEFDVYVKYAQIVTTQGSREALQSIVDNPELSERLDTAGHGFRLAVKYFLPKLLASPITHAFLYFDYVSMLLKLAPCTEDMEGFQQVEGLMRPIQKAIIAALEKGPTIEAATRMASRARRQVALEKINELANLIDNWDNKDIGLCCNEFIREDTLGKVGPGKRVTERRAFLFDGLLLLCKPCTGDKSKSELKMKERLYIRKMEIVDKPDTEEVRNCIELAPKCGNSVTLCCTGAIDKNRWMADLVMLNTKSMLDRTLDSILLDLERKHPLKLPPSSLYRFAIPDSTENIILEERHNTGVPLIKGATLLKLVERLTYHIYADPTFVKTFLMTYRSFCQPPELLDLLIERFNIPDPSLVYDAPEKAENVIACETEKFSKNSSREDFKRYRKEFVQPVQFRVLNVLRHWVDQHFYDFERDPSLLEKLRSFLDSITGKPMLKWVESVIKIVNRKKIGAGETRNASSPSAITDSHGGNPAPVFDNAAPPIERLEKKIGSNSANHAMSWHILMLHPIEVARQLTLLEFDMYRMVKPSELVGAAWTKKDKDISSPNLLRIIKHTTNFTRWIEKSIVEAENLEERGAVLRRMLEVMMVLSELNNFNGVLAVVSAMESASIFRLKFTFQMLTTRLEKALEECRQLIVFKKSQEKLRSINPPCVPFFGMYLTNILHLEDGNRDFLQNTELINFYKRRKVAEIIGEIQQYQNQPYCLQVEPKLRNFLENLNPFPGQDDNEIRDYLYNKSCEIEPKEARQAPRFARKWPELSLKSPGIKPARARPPAHSTTLSSEPCDDTTSVSQLSPTASMFDGSSLGYGSSISLQRSNIDEEPSSPRHHFQVWTSGPLKHSSVGSSSTFSLYKDSGVDSISPRLPSTSITELSSRMIENLTNFAPPISPRPPSTLSSSKNQDSSNKAPVISPRVPNPIININKGTNDNNSSNTTKEAVPNLPPRNFPSPDHQMVEFRNPNGPKWPNWSHSSDITPLGFIYDTIPPRLPNSDLNQMSCEERHLKIVNDIKSNVNNNQFSASNETSPRPSKPPALSPRNPIVDVNTSIHLGFSQTCDTHIFKYNSTKHSMKGEEIMDVNILEINDSKILKPSISCPRGNMRKLGSEDTNSSKPFNLEVDRSNKPNNFVKSNGDIEDGTLDNPDDPPVIVSRPKFKDDQSALENSDSDQPSDLDKPLVLSSNRKLSESIKQESIDENPSEKLENTSTPKSPAVTDLFIRSFEAFPAKMSPDLIFQGTHPPLSPHVNVHNSVQTFEKHQGTFNFPTYGNQANISPGAHSLWGSRPSPTMIQSYTGTPHTPPPLPPRKRRDSTPAATPIPTTAQPSPTFSSSTNVPAVPPRGSASPPPLPPRRQLSSAPLLGPDHSTILQRRHHNNNTYSGDQTPRLPPRPPSTMFSLPRVSQTREETQ